MTSTTDPLPDRLVLSPHRTVLLRGAGARQLGLDPERSTVADGLTPALAAMLDELIGPVPTDALVAGAVRRGSDAAGAESLLRMLLADEVVVDAQPALLRARRRGGSTVVVVGDGPLAVGVVIGLLQAGVGTVYARIGGTVAASDLGTGLLDADIGAPRGVAAATAARRIAPTTALGPPPRRLVPDLVVGTDTPLPRAATSRLHTDRVAHLPVLLRDGLGLVGPLVLPGRSACLHCLDLCRTDRDPGWPGVAAQLTGRAGTADPATVVATVGLGTAQALAALDGDDAPPVLEATVELDLTRATTVRRPWSPHPGCPCGAPPRGGGA